MAELPGGVNGVLAGRYRIDREIGQGGMATVYLAHDLRHDSLVAVKVLRAPFAEQLAGERFYREIRIAANLRHPNIVAVFDSGETAEGRPFYVMPYVEGETLEARIEREGALPITEAVAIAGDVADALAHAHAQGFVHRDVKPGNVLLSHGRALLSDFGIARAIHSEKAVRLTETGVSLGTVAYMSPEQAAGGPVDGRSDIYSLGCVLYEMIAGTPPFSGSARAVLARHVADSVPSLSVVRETVPAALEAAVVRSMAKLAADRYADATEFRDAIRKAIEVMGQPARTARPRRRLLRAAVFGVLLLAAAYVAGQMGLVGSTELEDHRIMVFPLVVPPDFAGPRTLGEDVATMIGNALDGTGPLRWIDAWPLLDPEWRENVRLLPSNAPRDLARQQRCAYYVMGRLVAVSADSADVSLTLHDARGDSTIATRSAKGAIANAWRQGLRAVNQLLPALIPGVSADVVAEWEDHNPSAIASFLLGEAAFRRARLEDALSHFRAAVAADSTLGLAGIRGAMTATWIHRSAEAESFIHVAQRQRLAPRYAAFARAYELYMRGAADSAVAALREVLALDPEMTAAWMQLGEVYMHLLPRGGNPDSLAEAAFTRANQLDPAASNVLFHLIEIRIRRGDERVGPLVRQFIAAEADADLTERTEIMHACTTQGPQRVQWRQLVATQPQQVVSAAGALAGRAGAECVEAAARAILEGDTAQTPDADGRRWGAFLLLQGVLMGRGQLDVMRALTDSARTRWGFGASLHLFNALIDESFFTSAIEVARADAASYGQGYRETPFITRLWELGLLEAQAGDVDVAEAVLHEMERRAAESGAVKDRVLARSAGIHVMLAKGDSAGAFRALQALVPATVPGDLLKWDEGTPLGHERLALARMYHRRGEHRQAIDIASVFDSAWPVIYPLFVPASLELRAEAAAALGDARGESLYRARLNALRQTAAAQQ